MTTVPTTPPQPVTDPARDPNLEPVPDQPDETGPETTQPEEPKQT